MLERQYELCVWPGQLAEGAGEKKTVGGAVRGKPLERLRSLLLRAAWSL